MLYLGLGTYVRSLDNRTVDLAQPSPSSCIQTNQPTSPKALDFLSHTPHTTYSEAVSFSLIPRENSHLGSCHNRPPPSSHFGMTSDCSYCRPLLVGAAAMGNSRKFESRYHADLRLAIEKNIPNISHITVLDDGYGTFILHFTHPLLQTPGRLEVRVSPQEWSGYPSEHFLVAQITGPHPAALESPLEEFPAQSFGVKIHESLESFSQRLAAALGAFHGAQDEQHSNTDENTQNMGGDGVGDSDETDAFEDFEVDEVNSIFGLDDSGSSDETSTAASFGNGLRRATLNRIKRDFRAAWAAGFKVGFQNGFSHCKSGNIVSLAVRADKLCLSKETHQAWGLGREDFVVLLIQYPRGYATYEETMDQGACFWKMQFRLRKCIQYRPSLADARKAFTGLAATKTEEDADDNSHLRLLSIGKSIDTFMDNDFVSMLKMREKEGVSWDDAKKLLTQMNIDNTCTVRKGKQLASQPLMPLHSHLSEDQAKLPAFIAEDYMACSGEVSLPLVAVRFAMRYLVRCLDYCMVCHEAVDDNFEALKPYVCSNSLCLFQYMGMGLGPSIDQEIMTQPNVVDLLISFCYSGLTTAYSGVTGPGGSTGHRAWTGSRVVTIPGPSSTGPGLQEYPTGLSIQVPKMAIATHLSSADEDPASVIVSGVLLTAPIKVTFRGDPSTVMLEATNDAYALREGQWVVVVVPRPFGGITTAHHGQVTNVYPDSVTLRIVSKHELTGEDNNNPVPRTGHKTTTAQSSELPNGDLLSYMLPYNQNMDELGPAEKSFAMNLLLESTPTVASMRAHLSAHPNEQIENWDGMTPSASKLLRWIIASNRSYIVQVDECPTQDGKPEPGLARHHEKISGVDGWLQFRFVQGSPERELRFQHALQGVKKQPKSILAWHGSLLSNWHSITRAGLNFDRVANGRAYGNGVYFARDFDMSRGYSGPGAVRTWPNSVLQVDAALSLNELVNLPEQYVSNNHNIYVVNDLGWIQCRYLFVRPKFAGLASAPSSSAVPKEAVFVQDAKYAATGVGGKPLLVPRAAIPSARNNERKQSQSDDWQTATGHSGDTGDEDSDDREFLLAADDEDDEDNDNHRKGRPTKTSPSAKAVQGFLLDASKTDFRPGSLDLDTLPKLAPPTYATPQGQRTIGREIARLRAVQSSSPIHELGWFIDFEKITNMFHWIVELHSFEPSLPLAADMKKAGVTSIVMELRFGREYPLSPPFVRVIRPRFVPFMHGGGGNVTAGGAMCMELLTNSGWSPVSSLESVLLQVRLALTNTDPQPARLQVSTHRQDYGIGEALDAYQRAANAHRWEIPSDLSETATGMVDFRG